MRRYYNKRLLKPLCSGNDCVTQNSAIVHVIYILLPTQSRQLMWNLKPSWLNQSPCEYAV